MTEKIYASLSRGSAPSMAIEHKPITLTCYLDDRRIGRQIYAYVCGGLALHEALIGEGRTITHMGEGVSIYQNTLHPLNYLRDILQEMASLTDWAQPFDTAILDLYGNKEELNRYRALIGKLTPRKEISPNGRHHPKR